jgi:hypothetical protein
MFPRPHGQLPLEDVEGLLVIAVEVGEGAMGVRRDDVVMNRVGAARIPVTDLDNHPSSYRILEDFTFVRANEESTVSRHHVFIPFYRSNVRPASFMIRLSRSLPA